MHQGSRNAFPDEAPTRQTPHVPFPVLVRLERIVRLADEATALLVDPIGSRVAEAVVALAGIRALAREVLS